MKKFLNISVIAALAILPLAANATDLTSEQMAYANPTTADATKVATTAYVKGAYKELGTAINSKQDKLSDTDLAAISSVSSLTGRVGDLETAVEGKAAASDVTALTTRVSTAESDITALETAVEGKAAASDVTALTTRVSTAESDITALEAASATHATKTGVTATITASSVTVPALLQWGDTTPQTVAANIAGAEYAEE